MDDLRITHWIIGGFLSFFLGLVKKSVFLIRLDEPLELKWTCDEAGYFPRPSDQYVFDDKNNLIKCGQSDYLYDGNGLLLEGCFDGETDDTFDYQLDENLSDPIVPFNTFIHVLDIQNNAFPSIMIPLKHYAGNQIICFIFMQEC